MIQPARLDEAAALATFLREQVEAVRTAAFGLTEEEARRVPARSDLSIGGILKHLASGWPTWQRREACASGERGWELTEDDYALFYGSFALTEEETLEQVLATYDAATAALVDAVATMDPGADAVEAPAPWFGRMEPTTVTGRMLALHLVEEFARHAGHADIVREQLDGALAGQLTMAVHDIPGNDFIQPWSSAAS
ncbi:DUF664 domain-containing protein [Nocardioides currus]|uniref:Mini-circle protein n=1 Tax=Nocardioides currus TaxID=2133958 RepID=A0A2R7Z301_9ACTN|nr:DUF664 domain-containing protein [Nocardioides currus]PUA82980.1 hypothetical protein C7S10_04670 [Nocardioides currus]